MKILFMSSTQTLAMIGTTTPTIRELLLPLSATSNRASITTMTSHVSGSYTVFGEKTTQIPTLHGHELFYPKNAGSNITSIPSPNLLDRSSLPSSPPSLHQPQTHSVSLYSTSLKPVLAPQLPCSVSDNAPNRIHIRRPLQRLFRPYPKLTPHLHLYPRLRLRNPYYTVKSIFDTSMNPMLRHPYKPTFWHCHNKLCRHLTSVNIP